MTFWEWEVNFGRSENLGIENMQRKINRNRTYIFSGKGPRKPPAYSFSNTHLFHLIDGEGEREEEEKEQQHQASGLPAAAAAGLPGPGHDDAGRGRRALPRAVRRAWRPHREARHLTKTGGRGTRSI